MRSLVRYRNERWSLDFKASGYRLFRDLNTLIASCLERLCSKVSYPRSWRISTDLALLSLTVIILPALFCNLWSLSRRHPHASPKLGTIKYGRTKASYILSRVLPGTRGRIRFKAPRPAYTFLQVAFSWEYLPNAWSISIPSCYTLYLLSVFSLVKSLKLILEISANYRLVSYLLADN